MNMEMLKDKILKLLEESVRQSDEQEAYIQELRQRLYLAESLNRLHSRRTMTND